VVAEEEVGIGLLLGRQLALLHQETIVAVEYLQQHHTVLVNKRGNSKLASHTSVSTLAKRKAIWDKEVLSRLSRALRANLFIISYANLSI